MKLHRRPARALVSATLALIVLFNLVSPALANPAEPAPASTSTPPSAVAVAPGSVGSISDQRAVASDASAGSSSGARAPSPTASSAQADIISGLQADLSTGAAVTRYPINTPPARQGIGPSLALVYNSRQGNGWVGVGWDLSLGTIERSTRYGAPTYTSSDTFVWSSPAGGGELVYLGDDVYQLKIDTLFYKFVWYGNYWEVWDKSGVKYVYGQNKPSCNQTPYACVNNGPGVLQWNLSRIVDPYGNYMTVSYVHDQGQSYPQRHHVDRQ